MSISSVCENPPMFIGHWFTVTEPDDLGFGAGVDAADHFGLVVGVGVYKCLFLYYLGCI